METKHDVRELPAKWRHEVDEDLDCATSWKTAHRKCANELEASLRQSDEATSGLMVDDAMVFNMAVWLAAREGHDDPHQLVWAGSPPEPCGEVWNRYEDDARSALTAAIAATHSTTQPLVGVVTT